MAESPVPPRTGQGDQFGLVDHAVEVQRFDVMVCNSV